MVNGVLENNQLKSFVERIQHLEEEKKAIGEDIKDVFAEAKASGFVPRIMRKCIALLKMDKATRDEEQDLLDIYKEALGLKSFDSTPLGEAAAANEDEPPSDDTAAEKPKRGRPKKVRDPSDGSESLVTVPEKQDA